MNSQCTLIFLTALSLQDFVLGPSRGVSYGVGMPTDLLHHQSGSTMSRLAYGQSPVGLYAQNQPLPAGRCTREPKIFHLFGNRFCEMVLCRSLHFLLLPGMSRYSDEPVRCSSSCDCSACFSSSCRWPSPGYLLQTTTRATGKNGSESPSLQWCAASRDGEHDEH